MKSKIKRHSRSVLAVILTLSMLVSCMMVGLIATDAARVTDSGTVGATADDESVGATDYYWNYEKDMPDGNYSASNHQALTQSSKATNKYYYIATLDTSSTYGMYMTYGGYGSNDKHYKPKSDFDAESNAAYKLTDKGVNNNYGNTSNREKYTTNSSDTQYIVTWDSTQNELYMSPTSAGVELRWDVQEGHSSYYNLDHTETMTQAADGYTYTCDIYLTGGTAYYLFGKVGNYYYRGTTPLTTGSFVQLYSYGKDNSGGSADKISYTPSTTGTYRFTWDNRDKTLSVAFVPSANSSYSLTGDIWSSCITQINGSANGITRGSETDAQWWGSYHSDAAISQSTGTAGEYYIDITTADRATLVAGNPTFKTVDIGLYNNSANKQKAFEIGGTYYNYIGGDYTVTSSGVTANIVDLASSNGGGALKLQPGRSYRITVNENTSKISVAEINHVDKYFLAGEYSDGSTQFFGEKWNTANNELVETSAGSGVYEKTFTTDIPAGTIKFKTVKNGDSDGWDGGSYPTQNQTYVINANATKVKFSFDATNNTMTVTQENSGGGEGGTWPPTDTAVTNVTESSTSTGKYLLVSNNDQFETNGSNTMTAVALSNKYETDSNAYYWADLTNYLNYNNIHIILSAGSNKNDAKNFGSDSKVNDKNFLLKDSNNNYASQDKYDYYDGSTKLFHAEGKDNNDGNDYFHRVEINQKHSSLNHLGVLIRTDKNAPSTNWIEYSFFYTDYVPPVVETKVVDIYAKNGTLRDSNYNRFTNLANTEILDYFYYEETNATTGEVTTYTSINGTGGYNAAHSGKEITIEHDKSYGNSHYDKMTNVPVGAKIKISTELSPNGEEFTSGNKFSDTHYLKAYSFNGMTYQVFKPSDAVATTKGEKYTEEWTVRAVNTTYKDSNGVLQNATTDGKTIEVTPIYYMKDNSNCKTFYIDGYDGEVQNAWGNLLCVYPYYEGIKEKGNAFGGYPGQPMLFWGGKYQMEIPLTVDGTANGASVKGLTLHNSFWDLFHRSKDIRCNARNHAQTYDYDDFYKLYKEKNPDTIIFDFKYRKTHDNYTDGYNYTNYSFAGSAARKASEYEASTHNGVELVTDYFGRQVDAFGNLITDANQSHYGEDNGSGGTVGQTKELLFVSTGYKDTYVGEYATLWAVYAPSEQMKGGDTANKFIGYISSSMLYLNNIDRRLQYTGGDDTSSGRMSWSSFINTYNHLKTNYVGVPALISYEKEIWNDSKDKANRSDGKWYYSNKSDKISASIKIQYGSHTLLNAPDHSVSSDAWHDDPFDNSQTGVGGGNNIGTNTGCSAYFTNTTPNLMGKVASGEQFADNTKSFTFLAVPSGSYMFAGWVRYSNGKYYEISEKEAAESPMSANDVYIARFVDAQVGSLTIQHVVEKTDEFNGTGTPRIQVTVKNNGTTVTGGSFDVSDSSKVDISKWIDSHFASYTIDISLTTTPTGESFMKEIESSSGNYATLKSTWNAGVTSTTGTPSETGAQSTTVAQFTVQSILDSGVTSLRYVSHLMSPKYTYNYEITYTYYSRFWEQQSYTQTGTCEEGDFTGAKDTATLTTDFIINKTPYEKNFREQINWNYTTSTVEAGDYDAAPMENNAASATASANTYKMTAHVYASKEVNDRVTAEFILPYYYNDKSQGYTVHNADVYANAEKPHGDYESDHTYLYDTSHESVTLDTQAYKLFTYDGGDVAGGNDVLASQTHLMEAAPYLMMDGGTGNEIEFHYQLVDKSRTYTGNSFTANGITYYLNEFPEGVSSDATHVVINSSNASNYKVTFTKIKYIGADHAHPTTYNYAVAEGTEGTYGYKIYFFSYKMNDNEQMVDNEGNLTDTPVFNGEVVVYSVDHEIDGIIKNTGVKKYFTRWDITNTKGEFVASCYNRRFNYSGYDNYIVRPVYESDEEQHYESSTGLNNSTMASITHLGDTRNQWNNSAKGDYATVTGKNDGKTAGDKLIHDFALAYAYNGQEIQTIPNRTTDSTNGHDIKIGMVIEKLDPLDSSGSTKIFDSTYYADKYKSTVNATLLSNLKSAAEGEMKFYAATGNHSCKNLKIGANVDEWGTKFGTSTTTALSFNSVIDNFNRLQWFYTFDNTKTGEGGTIGANNNANFAYRAWAYIIVDGTATVCNTPTYFTLYDSARR